MTVASNRDLFTHKPDEDTERIWDEVRALLTSADVFIAARLAEARILKPTY